MSRLTITRSNECDRYQLWRRRLPRETTVGVSRLVISVETAALSDMVVQLTRQAAGGVRIFPGPGVATWYVVHVRLGHTPH